MLQMLYNCIKILIIMLKDGSAVFKKQEILPTRNDSYIGNLKKNYKTLAIFTVVYNMLFSPSSKFILKR